MKLLRLLLILTGITGFFSSTQTIDLGPGAAQMLRAITDRMPKQLPTLPTLPTIDVSQIKQSVSNKILPLLGLANGVAHLAWGASDLWKQCNFEIKDFVNTTKHAIKTPSDGEIKELEKLRAQKGKFNIISTSRKLITGYLLLRLGWRGLVS